MRAEKIENLLLLSQLSRVGSFTKSDKLIIAWQGKDVRILCDDRRSEIDHVATVVPVFWHGFAMGAGHHRRTEHVHLHAAIVDVELASDVRTGCAKDPRDRITHGGPSRVPQVKRSRRVRGNEFDVDLRASEGFTHPVVRSRLNDPAGNFRVGSGLQSDVHEAGPSHVHLSDSRVATELRCQRLGYLPRWTLHPLGQHHRHVRGVVAMLTTLGALDHDLDVGGIHIP